MDSVPALALIGDLIDSRQIDREQRYAVQTAWNELFAAWTPPAGDGMAARPTITLGDEFQGLFPARAAGVDAVLDLMERALDAARPAAVRFGLGAGELTTPLREVALGMDGPCFHRAREALEGARADGLPCRIDTGRAPADAVWGALASYCLRERTGWSDLQWEAIAAYGRLGSWSAAAAELGVTRGAVSQRQQAAGWSLYRRAWRSLAAELKARLETGGGA